ncbi:MAG: DUF2934 domain-containing protein [Candidatus Thiodiazotropha sp.]
MGKKSDRSLGKHEHKPKQSESDKKEKKSKPSEREKKEKKSKRDTKGKKPKKRGEKNRKETRKAAATSSRASPEQRLEMIAKAAYYIAERHGFTPGMEDSDWQTAERQIDDMLKNEG